MRALRVLFADDERMARARMRRLLSAIQGVEIVAECESGEQVLARLDELDVDACFLDVRMGGLGGLDVAELAPELGVEVVFTTAHPEHAVTAFEQGAVDYVLKPVEAGRLALAVARVRQRLEAARVVAPKAESTATRLALEVRGEVRMVDTEQVSHALHDGTLVTVFAGGEALLTDLSLAELEARLPRENFERVHRRALLSLAHVERFRPLPSGGYVAVTKSGAEVPVSRQAARRLRKRMKGG